MDEPNPPSDQSNASPRRVKTVVVRRPSLLLAALASTLAAFTLAGFGWLELHAVRTTPPPTELADQGEAIAEAFAAAPWLTAAPDSTPRVWALAPAACSDCARFHRETVARLTAADPGLRVVVFPGPGASAEEIALVAALAKGRDWDAYRRFADGGVMVNDASMTDPAEIEGFAEWARASAERLADLGAVAVGPALIWSDGGRWRMVSGAAALDPVRVQRWTAPVLSSLAR